MTRDAVKAVKADKAVNVGNAGGVPTSLRRGFRTVDWLREASAHSQRSARLRFKTCRAGFKRVRIDRRTLSVERLTWRLRTRTSVKGLSTETPLTLGISLGQSEPRLTGPSNL
jgi:hypothetical protein